MTEANDPSAAPRHRLYDYYSDRDRESDDTTREAIKPQARTSAHADVRELRAHYGAINGRPPVIVRRQPQESPEQDYSDDQGDQPNARPRSALPPQPSPAQSFLGGLFGDNRSDDSD